MFIKQVGHSKDNERTTERERKYGLISPPPTGPCRLKGKSARTKQEETGFL